MKKRVLSFIPILIILVLVFTVAATAEETVYSGECGKDGANVTWKFDTSTGELVISGSGEMKNYLLSTIPWESYSSSITKLNFLYSSFTSL